MPRWFKGLGVAQRPWRAWAGLAAVTSLALALFVWGLSRNGMGNIYYAAAVKSGSLSWKAWFFGAFDPASYTTVDKLPASLWVPGLFVRVFGFSSWSILLPQALAGVASVLILHHLARRWQGEAAALLAALAFAVTPVAVVMFRLNAPDALLTLLFLCAAWALWSALETGSTGKIVLCGAILGLAFLTKMLEAFVVAPAFVLTYLVCGPRRVGRRLLQSLAGLAALAAAGGWWVAVVELWPRASRPHVGGSTSGSVLDLVFSRNAGYLSTPPSVPNFSGEAGWLRMFNEQFGGQIAWLIPLALVGLLAGLWVTRRGARADRVRAGYLLWGLWAVVCLVLFSLAKGVLHPYYVVVLAPALAALAGGGAVALWRMGRRHRLTAWLLPAVLVCTALLARLLLSRTPAYAPGLAAGILIAAGVGAAGLVGVMVWPRGGRPWTAITGVAATIALASALAGPVAYSVSTAARSVDGVFATAGPQAATRFAFMTDTSGGAGVPAASTAGSADESSAVKPFGQRVSDKRLVEYLIANQGDARFLVAAQGALVSAPFIIATGEPVISLGGFDGTDPAPSLAEFRLLVDGRQVRYVMLGGLGAITGGFGSSFLVAQWVQGHGKPVQTDYYGGYLYFGMLYQLW